jgi:hypothetical protein
VLHLALTIDRVDFIDSSVLGYNIVTGAITAGVNMKMAGREEHQLELIFKSDSAKVNLTAEFDTMPDEYIKFHTQIHNIEVGDIYIVDSFFGDVRSHFYEEFFKVYFMITFKDMNRKMRQEAAKMQLEYEVFTLKAVEYVNFDRYIEIGGDFEFKKQNLINPY